MTVRAMLATAAAGVILASGCGESVTPEVRAAEDLVDAFYSYDADRLAEALGSSPSAPFVLYYQGWAEGAGYTIVDRMPCEQDQRVVTCSITVDDELVNALAIEQDTTDTFSITVDEEGTIGEVSTSSDDTPAFRAAFEAVLRDDPALLEPGGPCEGFFQGGPTPGDCARAFVGQFSEMAG